MAKVLLVEDDNNLREIFEMRVQAEGYDTVVAGDGEEGLVVAMKERPDLIVADVMMPKLSGFEMLETLRAAPEMANTKVVMMTALGQAEDQARGEKLGVVKYLVKSQVTLEDFARVIKEVLEADGDAPSNPPKEDSGDKEKVEVEKKTDNNNTNNESEKSMPEDSNPLNNPMPDVPSADPAANPISGQPPVESGPPAMADQQSSAQEQTAVNDQINSFVSSSPAPSSADSATATATPSEDVATPTEHSDIPVAEPPASEPGASDGTAPAVTSDPATTAAPTSETQADTPAQPTAPTGF